MKFILSCPEQSEIVYLERLDLRLNEMVAESSLHFYLIKFNYRAVALASSIF